MDPRHLDRIKVVQNLFAYSFKQISELPYPDDKNTQKILEKITEIDATIKKHAPRYPLESIARTNLAILRMSIFDLIYNQDIPEKVTINEAVELGKELSGEHSYAFINAVLGKILSEIKK